jgi:hypothetical protein
MTRAFLGFTAALVLTIVAAIAPATAQFPPPPAPATPVAPAVAPLATAPAKPAVSSKKKTPTPRGPSIAGKWSGELTQVDNPTPYKFELAIGPKGAETKYPDLDCTGKLTRVGSSKSYVFFVEIITSGRSDKGGRCPDGTITVARQGDELLWHGLVALRAKRSSRTAPYRKSRVAARAVARDQRSQSESDRLQGRAASETSA